MGFLDFLQNKKKASSNDSPVILATDAKGAIVLMKDIQDVVFSQGILGPCCGIDPLEGKVYAPIDGDIIQLADTFHAIGIRSISGVEVLLHVGIDTVEMNGDGFEACIKEGDKVKKGQCLLNMDLQKIQAAGHLATVITIVTNGGDFSSVEIVAEGEVEPGMDMIRVV